MTPGLGNKYAYQEFRKKNVPGVWASIDLNDLKHLNDVHGHDAGDALIRAFGAAARTGADSNKVKLFRSGGDEFVMHAPDAGTAYNTMRSIRHHVDQVPHINGVYRPSFSVGFGHSFEDADKALYQAKARKVTPAGQRAFAPGQVPHLAHSAVPGSEGPVPLDESQLGLTAAAEACRGLSSCGRAAARGRRVAPHSCSCGTRPDGAGSRAAPAAARGRSGTL
jgi:diguanylate cyclase (GGDEF)-like protein